jgi:hypothetical protein
MFQFKKCLLFAALAVASLSAVSTAGATSVTVGPTSPTNITGTSPTTLLTFHNASKTWSCTSASTTGTAASNASGLLVSSNVKLSFTGCSVAGIGLTVACSSTAKISATAATAGGNTPGAITSISCHMFVTASTTCRVMITGSLGLTFNDPAAGSGAKITTDINHINLTASSATCTAVLPNDTSVRFSASPAGTSAVYTLSPTNLTVSATP